MSLSPKYARVIWYQLLGFGLVMLLIWVDELFDLPHLLFGASATPINWYEALFESIVILLLGAVMLKLTINALKHIKYLEGMLPICASCKRIRDPQGAWHPVDTYIHQRSDVEFSHGLCPECMQKLYSE